MVGTLNVRVVGIKGVQKDLVRLQRNLPKANKKAMTEIGRKTAKFARDNLSKHTEMTQRLKSLIKSDKVPKRAGRSGWKIEVLAEREAAFWEDGVKKHWVSFFNEKKKSIIGTPRSKFRDWARKQGISDLEMRALQALEVEIPRTKFMTKAHKMMAKRVGGIVTKHLNKALK